MKWNYLFYWQWCWFPILWIYNFVLLLALYLHQKLFDLLTPPCLINMLLNKTAVDWTGTARGLKKNYCELFLSMHQYCQDWIINDTIGTLHLSMFKIQTAASKVIQQKYFQIHHGFFIAPHQIMNPPVFQRVWNRHFHIRKVQRHTKENICATCAWAEG